jgi:hypothetical protein
LGATAGFTFDNTSNVLTVANVSAGTVYSPNFYGNAVVYANATGYLTNNNLQTDKHDIIIPKSWKIFDLEWAINKIQSNLPDNNYLKKFEISDDHEKSWPDAINLHCLIGNNPVQRVHKMHYNNYKVNQLRMNYQTDNNIEYDYIIKIRPDSDFDSNINLKNIKIERNEILMPNNNWFGDDSKGMFTNDQFAIGGSDSMNIYSNLINFINQYNTEGVIFHPESLLAHHLYVNKITCIRGEFKSLIKREPLLDSWC